MREGNEWPLWTAAPTEESGVKLRFLLAMVMFLRHPDSKTTRDATSSFRSAHQTQYIYIYIYQQIKHPTYFHSYPSSSFISFLLISSVLRIIAEKILQQRAEKKFHSWSQRIWSVIWCLSEPEDETNMYYRNSYNSCWKLNLSTTERHTHPQKDYHYYHTVEHQTAHRCNKKHRNINVEMKDCKVSES